MKRIFLKSFLLCVSISFFSNIFSQEVLVIQSCENQTDAVYTSSIDAYDNKIITAGRNNIVYIYNISDEEVVSKLVGHTDYINDAIFSPDATLIASASNDNTVKLWNSETNSLLFTLEGHSDDVKSLKFSTDGKRLASGSLDNTIKIWNTETGDLIYNLYGYSDKVNSIAFSPDNKFIISGARDNLIRKYDIKEGTLIRDYKAHTAEVKCVDYNPDGKTFASCSYDNSIKIWDVETGEINKTLTGHTGSVNYFDYSSDGNYIVSCGSDNKIKLWNVETGICIHTFEGHDEIIYSVKFNSNDKYLISASEDKTAKIWNVDKIIRFQENTIKDSFSITSDENSIQRIAFNYTNSEIAFATYSGKIQIFDLKTKTELIEIDSKIKLNSITYSPDNIYIIAGGNDSLVNVFDIKTGDLTKTFEGHSGTVECVDITSDGKYIVSGSTDKNVKVWKFSNGEVLNNLFGYSDVVNCIDISSDGLNIISGSDDGKIRLWDLQTGELLKTLEGHSGAILSVGFSPDNKSIVSSSYDKTIKIWDTMRGNCSNTISKHTNTVYSVAFSPDGKYFASGAADFSVKIWEKTTGILIYSYDNLDFIVNSVSFSPDGLYLAAAGEGNEIKIWNVGDLIEVEDITENVIAVTSRKAIASEDKTPPEFAIISPVADADFKFSDVSNTDKKISIKGKSDDESGVFEVIINGKDASLSESGLFQSDVLLKVGLNEISVSISDLQGNTIEQKYFVTRLSEFVAESSEDAETFYAGTYYALIFGVSDYVDENIPDLDSLPIKDAEKLANVLKTNYTFTDFNVNVIYNPTRKDIIRAFDDLVKKVTTEDNVLIFYAGHGNYDAENELGYWIPSDAELDYTDNWVYNDLIVANLKRIKSRHTLLISDACFSGSIFKSRDISTANVLAYYKKYELPSRKAMTSGTLKTVPNKSVFLEYLVEKLEMNEETYLSASELFQQVEIPVGNNSPTTPQYGVIQGVGDEGGDFIFIKK